LIASYFEAPVRLALSEATIRGGCARESAQGKVGQRDGGTAERQDDGKAAGAMAGRRDGGMAGQRSVESSGAGSLKPDSRRDRHMVMQASDNHAIVSHGVTGYTVLDGAIDGVIA
jgi:hypothetical protein